MMTLLGDALMALVHTEDRVIRVVGTSPRDTTVGIELVLHEAPLREAMIAFGWRILGLSIVISLITATLVFLALQAMRAYVRHDSPSTKRASKELSSL